MYDLFTRFITSWDASPELKYSLNAYTKIYRFLKECSHQLLCSRESVGNSNNLYSDRVNGVNVYD